MYHHNVENRDEKTAKMAVRAALTGTLVITSLHSRSTISAIRRMLELGVNQNDLAAVTIAIFNQQLLKMKNQNKYTCIYDVLEEAQINAYLFDNCRIETQMEKRIKEAVDKGIIEAYE